ncbi:Short-chain dehydrogenase reductase 3a [Apostasia shenzhenica]|uniref:Short-chain dehydrogenase reductase 3a n=1 Tax=Apostasia shenzhenica TaxID=1088818 RepID=A0A2I0APR7_9ASPA|nr:Short-chain dehydrogenase reductase 3a [Apostasia shenzhenica]
MADKLRLKGMVAIITGGASGIGEATACLFAAPADAAIITDIQDSLGSTVAASISPPSRCTFSLCSRRPLLQIVAAADHAVKTHGRLDVMFNNASIVGSVAGFLDLNMANLDVVLTVNVRGSAVAIKHVGQAMAVAGTLGSIIYTTSIAALQAS